MRREDESVDQTSTPDSWKKDKIYRTQVGMYEEDNHQKHHLSSPPHPPPPHHHRDSLVDADSAQPIEDRQEYVGCHWGCHHVGKVDRNKLQGKVILSVFSSKWQYH